MAKNASESEKTHKLVPIQLPANLSILPRALTDAGTATACIWHERHKRKECEAGSQKAKHRAASARKRVALPVWM